MEEREKSEQKFNEEEGLIEKVECRCAHRKSPNFNLRAEILSRRTLFEGIVLVLLLLALAWIGQRRFDGGGKGFGPDISKTVVEFGQDARLGPDLVYADEEMFRNNTRLTEVYNNWQKLYPRGRGFVKLRPSDYHDLRDFDPPYETDIFQNGTVKEGHVLTVFHSLHCLTVMMVGLGKREENSSLPIWQPHHQAHCLEYLRQTILCSADTSLEGRGKHWKIENGYGTQHMCVDYESLTRWTSERAPVHFDDKHKPF